LLVRACGEIDSTNASLPGRALAAATERGRVGVRADSAEETFFDCAALRTPVRAAARVGYDFESAITKPAKVTAGDAFGSLGFVCSGGGINRHRHHERNVGRRG
jgi:hypothetical protein